MINPAQIKVACKITMYIVRVVLLKEFIDTEKKACIAQTHEIPSNHYQRLERSLITFRIFNNYLIKPLQYISISKFYFTK